MDYNYYLKPKDCLIKHWTCKAFETIIILLSVLRWLQVGIVGRTGVGKSSLVSAIFRFAYIDGNISIDGVDTALLPKQVGSSFIS